MVDYWAAVRAEEISQGDFISDAWIGSSVSPRVGLQQGQTGKGGVKSWVEGAFSLGKDGFGSFLGRAKPSGCIVLSQNCEMDKHGGRAPVLIAPVLGLVSGVPDEALRDQYRQGRRYAFFPLAPLEGILVESYVDLRAISFMPRAVLDSLDRRASASSEGVAALTTHLVAFFTRIDMDEIVSVSKPAAA